MGIIVKRSQRTLTLDAREVKVGCISPALAQQATVPTVVTTPHLKDTDTYLPHLHVHHASFLQRCMVRFTWAPYLTGSSHSSNYQLRQAEGSNLSSWLNSAGRKQQADLEQVMGAAAQNLPTKHNLQTHKKILGYSTAPISKKHLIMAFLDKVGTPTEANSSCLRLIPFSRHSSSQTCWTLFRLLVYCLWYLHARQMRQVQKSLQFSVKILKELCNSSKTGL